MRNEKYKAKPEDTHRSEIAEENWSTRHLVQEFSSLLGQNIPNSLTTQMNVSELSSWINKKVGQGVTRPQMLKAIRMFFDDPRNLNNAGIGVPIWRRFIAYYQSVEGLVTREETKVYMTEEDLAHQRKMIKLLGGTE